MRRFLFFLLAALVALGPGCRKAVDLVQKGKGEEQDTYSDSNSDTGQIECDIPIAFTEHNIENAFYGAIAVHSADLDGDIDLDVLGAAVGLNSVTWWENIEGDGSIWIEYTISNSFVQAASVHSADLDGDSDLDVLGTSQDGSIKWWENDAGDGSSWTDHIIDDSFILASSLHSADLDGDTDLDVLCAVYADGTIAWWENNVGDGSTWTEHAIDNSFDGAISAHAADLNGDTDLDVLATSNTGSITWWENTASNGSSWTEYTIDDSFNEALLSYPTDLDGDTDLDVLAASNTGSIIWWENTAGNGFNWTEHNIDDSFAQVSSINAADLDGDTDLDVLVASNLGSIAWWENTAGDGSSWTEHAIDDFFDGALSVYVADLDGDLDLDVLGAAYSADSITWWENSCVP